MTAGTYIEHENSCINTYKRLKMDTKHHYNRILQKNAAKPNSEITTISDLYNRYSAFAISARPLIDTNKRTITQFHYVVLSHY